MTYAAIGKFKCDGCKVVESDPIEIPSDLLQPMPPLGWLRVETCARYVDLDKRDVKHFCRFCAKSVESFLAGRRLEDDLAEDPRGHDGR